MKQQLIASALVAISLLLATFLCVSADIPAHLITNLPGQPAGVRFHQYAGYITVDASHGRRLFYYFAQSQNNPEKDPVVLWLNGGPGCSSVIGLFSECGPFFAGPDGKSLLTNPWSWNRQANVIFLESPAGVGFSYSDTLSDYTIGDAQTARDNRQFLVNWFSNYSEFAKNDFYITGESYAGHYIPTLAAEILKGNAEKPSERINLVGIAVGNGLTDQFTDFNSVVPMDFWHGLFSSQVWDQLQRDCKGDYVNNNSPACQLALSNANRQVGDIDPYDIYATICHSSSGKPRSDNQVLRFLRYHPFFKLAGLGAVRAKMDAAKMRATSFYDVDPCIDDHLTNYMNLPSVQQALHVKPVQWDECSNVVNYNFSVDSMLPYYQLFFNTAPQLRILIYSGDVDTVLPFIGTQACTRLLNRPLVESWRSWSIDVEPYGNQVAGYVVKYDQFYFLTVKGAGHEVPFFQSQPAYEMINRFMQGRPF